MLQYSWQLLRDFIRWFPLRLKRFFVYLVEGVQGMLLGQLRLSSIAWWWLGLLLLLLDVIGVIESYEFLANSFKSTSRRLTAEEIKLAQEVFGDSLDYARIRIDERAWVGPKQYHFCYVSFHIINSWGEMRDDIFIHELVHVWQYQQVGAAYIAKALAAQWGEGYDYGGLVSLQAAKTNGLPLWQFNYEQQADIIMDYYRLLKGRAPRWGRATSAEISYYRYFVDQLRAV